MRLIRRKFQWGASFRKLSSNEKKVQGDKVNKIILDYGGLSKLRDRGVFLQSDDTFTEKRTGLVVYNI